MVDRHAEEVELTPDSRTHQFVALCRERPLTELLPSWLTRDDVSAEQPSAAILDKSPVWSDCPGQLIELEACVDLLGPGPSRSSGPSSRPSSIGARSVR